MDFVGEMGTLFRVRILYQPVTGGLRYASTTGYFLATLGLRMRTISSESKILIPK
jgi:hypothetical protein